MIALIRETLGRSFGPMAQLPAQDKAQADKRIFTNATLIIAPKNLFEQWAQEIEKFCPELEVLKIDSFTRLKPLHATDLMKPDVVLVSFAFFFSEAYRKAVDRYMFNIATEHEV